MIRRSHSPLPRVVRDKSGAAAIEFAILSLPLFVLVFGILELAAMFFVDTALDAALHKSARLIRTGQAAEKNTSLADFKAAVCEGMVYLLNCESNLLVVAKVVSNVSTAATMTPADSDGNVTITESFNIGYGSDYILVQAFLPWSPVVPVNSLSSQKFFDGSYVLGAAVLFRNEPF
ncbi:TadE/TadG family type IV pilus assembly protein [Rhizobium giardinii]|uniref:Flp pilus assembly protein TadG n=1 Tax=Rhizobium giardinii TaxID=56731 RepID=A0A7W8X932_9HYPH|nr:TadE/TadG family type IV pilus assembly protein [Rhizobium giardinii]MBB5537905.1 Flp pilus assembly protein TadG [Rhizobium giardinii]